MLLMSHQHNSPKLPKRQLRNLAAGTLLTPLRLLAGILLSCKQKLMVKASKMKTVRHFHHNPRHLRKALLEMGTILCPLTINFRHLLKVLLEVLIGLSLYSTDLAIGVVQVINLPQMHY
jgi:hypothetical protein